MFPKKYIFILIFFAAVLLCGKEANAATEFISTIRAAGGDYSLLSTWEAAVQSNLTASTTVVYSGSGTGALSAASTVELFRGGTYQNVTARVIATSSSQMLVQTFTGDYKVLQDGDQWRKASSTANMWTVSSAGLGDSAIAVAQIDGAWAAADTTAVTISGWTTSATNYIKVYTTASARHNGKPGTGYRLITQSSNRPSIHAFEDHVRIEGLEVKNTNTYNNSLSGIIFEGLSGAPDTDVRLIGLLVHNCSSPSGYEGHGINISFGGAGRAGKVIIANSIFYGNQTDGIRAGTNYAALNVYSYNNTFVNNGRYGLHKNWSNNVVAKNNIAYNNTDNYNGTFTSSTNNLSGPTQTDAPGTNPINAAKVIFLNEANDDFHLAPNDYSAVNAGADLSVDSYLDFTDDIDGETRPVGAAWDIGADETALTKFRFDGGQMKIRGTIKFE